MILRLAIYFLIINNIVFSLIISNMLGTNAKLLVNNKNDNNYISKKNFNMF